MCWLLLADGITLIQGFVIQFLVAVPLSQHPIGSIKESWIKLYTLRHADFGTSIINFEVYYITMFIRYDIDEFDYRFWDLKNQKFIRSMDALFNENIMYEEILEEMTI